ncbi:unnamed protein product [Hapterophycus canaliculatus]
MPGNRLLRGGIPSSCSLINPRKDFVTPKNNFELEPDKRGLAPAPVAAPAADHAAPVAFATDDFAELVWPSNLGTISAEDEEAEVLNDLLHLGLELGDLESVFGDTDCAPTSRSSSSSSADVDVAGEGEAKAEVEAEGEGECTILEAEERVTSYMENCEEGAVEELVLLDADLQDALLSLGDLEPEPTEDHALCSDSSVDKNSFDFSTCGNTSDDSGTCCEHETVGCWAFDMATSGHLTPSVGGINAALDVEHCEVPPLSATAGAAAISRDRRDVIVLGYPADRCRQPNTPRVLLRGEDLLADFDASGAATELHQKAAASDAAASDANPFPIAIEVEGMAAGITPSDVEASGSGGGGGGDGGSSTTTTTRRESRQPGHIDGEDDVRANTSSPGLVVAPTPAASTPTAAAAATVPTRLLDAIDLWESANAHAIAKKKAAATAAATAAREHARSTGATKSSNTTSTTKCKNRKKKNEFGKRRRSSGGGDQGAPVLETPKSSGAAAAGALAGKAKGKSNARGRGRGKGKKVDPLVRIRDARHLSRKPLIVQWLKSDGCDSDEEAEAALGKAVGSLSAISRYWSGGG